jgi:hypothetical protein
MNKLTDIYPYVNIFKKNFLLQEISCKMIRQMDLFILRKKHYFTEKLSEDLIDIFFLTQIISNINSFILVKPLTF